MILVEKHGFYFLIEKSEAFAGFKNFKVHVEKETNSFIIALSTDRERKFTSQEFNNFCEVNGIRRQLTTAYTSQQNGVAKRKKITIMNMVRSMISAKKLPKSFWSEAVNWTVHVLNRNPTLVVKNKTQKKLGVESSLQWSILEFLVVLLMFMCLTTIGPSWMIRA